MDLERSSKHAPKISAATKAENMFMTCGYGWTSRSANITAQIN